MKKALVIGSLNMDMTVKVEKLPKVVEEKVQIKLLQ